MPLHRNSLAVQILGISRFLYLGPVRIEGKGHLPDSVGFGLILWSDTPLSVEEISRLETDIGAKVFSLNQLFGLESITLTTVYDRFKEILSGLTKKESSVMAVDLPRDSPSNVLAAMLLRRWLKGILKHNRKLIPGLYLRENQERIIRLAKPLSQDLIDELKGWDQLRRYLLTKIRMMDSALELQSFYRQHTSTSVQETIPEPFDETLIAREIEALAASQRVCKQATFEVWLARAEQIPVTIKEIGRLREITFRQIHEGTGKSLDIDEYDLYYDQLIIWDTQAKRIAGGYRIGRGDHIFQTYGAQGFYIHSLFRINEGFFPIFPQSLELGRSYIISEYQKKRLPLFLLWKGILQFLLANPKYRYLYGPVSISSHYSDISRSLIIYFVRKHFYDKRLSKFLKPRKKFKYPVNKKTLELLTSSFDGDLDKLSGLIEDIEPDHFRIPVLLRQYVRQNAKFISFNIDPNFSDALDGFIILDLQELPRETLDSLQKEQAPDS